MAESNQHIELVNNLYMKIRDEILNGDDGRIFADLPSCNKYTRSPIIPGGTRPDIYVEYMARHSNKKKIIIGEAKTARDIVTKHSMKQYSAIFEWCKLNKEESLVIFAVPFSYSSMMKNLIKNNFRLNCNNIKIQILEL